MWKLARRHNIPIGKLIAANKKDVKNINLIHTGQKLEIPGEREQKAEWYERGAGLLAWPFVQAVKGAGKVAGWAASTAVNAANWVGTAALNAAGWVYDQFAGEPDRAREFLDTYKEKVIDARIKYRLGGSLFDTPSETDCSGAPRDVLRDQGYREIPEWANTDWFIDNKNELGLAEIQRRQLKYGDWVFFKSPNPDAYPRYRHMAVYAGKGKVYNAWESKGYWYSDHKKLRLKTVQRTHVDGYRQSASFWRPDYKKMWMRGRR